jgi:hypothetical protein
MEAAEHGMGRLTAQLESGHSQQQAQKREVRIVYVHHSKVMFAASK